MLRMLLISLFKMLKNRRNVEDVEDVEVCGRTFEFFGAKLSPETLTSLTFQGKC